MDDSIKKYIVLSEKSWHNNLYQALVDSLQGKWILISKKEEFSIEILTELNPDIIFIPHWSYIITPDIYKTFVCIVFHMTDLPFGRGGSPLQNLIALGYKETMISALKVEKGIDSGNIYLKKKLSLNGKASEIFERASLVIKEMIEEIISKKPIPQLQQGEPVFFKRRSKKDGEIGSLVELEKVYDYIRMLDCEGYPNAFIENNNFRFEFYNAFLSDTDKCITANVRIIKK
jgi:methionyl-tRNA formyltransferase